jgi:hypothetical protein
VILRAQSRGFIKAISEQTISNNSPNIQQNKKGVEMKTLKLALIATFVTLAMGSFAGEGSDIDRITKKRRVIHLSLERAVQNPELLQAMYSQLYGPEFMAEESSTYTAEITMGRIIYKITGTFEQWARFFRIGGPCQTDPVPIYDER